MTHDLLGVLNAQSGAAYEIRRQTRPECVPLGDRHGSLPAATVGHNKLCEYTAQQGIVYEWRAERSISVDRWTATVCCCAVG